MASSSALTPDEYNEPVYYCRDCHSLKVIINESLANDEWDGSYCGDCGSANIGECCFGEWLGVEHANAERAGAREWNR